MKKWKWIAVMLSAGLCLTACASTLEATQDNIVGQDTSGDVREDTREEFNNGANDDTNDEGMTNPDTANKSFQGEPTIIDTEAAFSKRDLSGEYEEEQCEKITLRDNASTTDSANVAIDTNIITIQKEGTYIIDGSMENGMVIVDVDKTEKVQLVLNGVSIKSDTCAPIYVKKADRKSVV